MVISIKPYFILLTLLVKIAKAKKNNIKTTNKQQQLNQLILTSCYNSYIKWHIQKAPTVTLIIRKILADLHQFIKVISYISYQLSAKCVREHPVNKLYGNSKHRYPNNNGN